jgi:hypothetical protein
MSWSNGHIWTFQMRLRPGKWRYKVWVCAFKEHGEGEGFANGGLVLSAGELLRVFSSLYDHPAAQALHNIAKWALLRE